VSLTPVVSVLMTAYNRERYIAASIESVLAQRFGDFELIVVDDGSKDGTVDIARYYAGRDRRVRLEVNEHNLGQFGNRNRAASMARGRYLKYHDSDDLMYPYCLELMVGHLDREPRAGLALSASIAWHGGPVPMLLTPRQCYQREFLGFGLFRGGPAVGLLRSEVFHDLGGFAEEGVYSDHLFWLKACARHSVLLLPADLFWYRTHAGQELRSQEAARAYARLPGYVWDALASPDCPIEGSELEQARRNHAWVVAKHFWRELRSGRVGLAAYRLKHARMSARDWLRYLRRGRRSDQAGVALDEYGDVTIPECLRWPRREG
jgi:glycosyltransferase involved in cell wall biosynthesis